MQPSRMRCRRVGWLLKQNRQVTLNHQQSPACIQGMQIVHSKDGVLHVLLVQWSNADMSRGRAVSLHERGCNCPYCDVCSSDAKHSFCICRARICQECGQRAIRFAPFETSKRPSAARERDVGARGQTWQPRESSVGQLLHETS